MPASTNLKLGIFDLDGTLIHLEHEYFADQIEANLKLLGMQCPSHAEIRFMVDAHDLTPLFSDKDEERVFWANYEEGDPPQLRLFEPALSTITNILDRNMDVAIATARQESVDDMKRKLAHTGLLNHVDFISTFYGTSWRDKIEQITLACHHHGVSPEHSMMVGDGPGDMMSAAAVGCGLRIAIKNGHTPLDFIIKYTPHAVVSCIGEVPHHLDILTQEQSNLVGHKSRLNV